MPSMATRARKRIFFIFLFIFKGLSNGIYKGHHCVRLQYIAVHIVVVVAARTVGERLVLFQYVEGFNPDFGRIVLQELLAQREVPQEVVLRARVEAGIADVVERAAEGQSPEEGPTQLGGSRVGHVVAARGGVQRTEHLVDARRVGSREVEVFADVAADYHLGNEVQLACPAFHTVENGGYVGIVGRKAEVDVTAQEVNRETIGQHGLQAVVSVQIDGTGELRAFVERHRRRELDVFLGHEGTVGYIVLLDIG